MNEAREIAEPREKPQEVPQHQESAGVQSEPASVRGEGGQMVGNLQSLVSEQFAEAYTQVDPQEVEEFYLGYHLWRLQQRASTLEKQIEILREHIQENNERLQLFHPSALSLAVLARLQANGVLDVELLDRMLERGEEWLDKTMQHLDYCEQVEDFIRGDYTQWCTHALEGAYDWIDSMLESAETTSPPPPATNETVEEIQATEELLLQKLSSDDEAAMLEITLKMPAFKPRRRDTRPLREDMAQEVNEAAVIAWSDASHSEDTQQRSNTRPLAEAGTELASASELATMETIEESPASSLQEANIVAEPADDEAREAAKEGEVGHKPEDEAAEVVATPTSTEESLVESEEDRTGEILPHATVEEIEIVEQPEMIEVTPVQEDVIEYWAEADQERSALPTGSQSQPLPPAVSVEDQTASTSAEPSQWEDLPPPAVLTPPAEVDHPDGQVLQLEVNRTISRRRKIGFWRRLLGWFWKT